MVQLSVCQANHVRKGTIMRTWVIYHAIKLINIGKCGSCMINIQGFSLKNKKQKNKNKNKIKSSNKIKKNKN